MKKILIINLARFGDIVQTIPMIEGINHKYPGCEITMLVNSGFINVCSVIPGLHRTVGLDFRSIYNLIFKEGAAIEDGYQYIKQQFFELRKLRFDKIYNITPHDIGIITTYLSGKENEFWSNITDWSKYYINITKNWSTLTLNVVDLFKRIANVSRVECTNKIKIDAKLCSYADKILKSYNVSKNCFLVGFQPGASTDDKKWPLNYFISLADGIINGLNAKIILFGGKGDMSDGTAIEEKYKASVINMIGKTDIMQLSALMSKTDILITNDTGPMHIASFSGTKVISINMGKELCETTGPYGENNISLQPKINCYPCLKPKLCSSKTCRSKIKPKPVYELIKYLHKNINCSFDNYLTDEMNIYVSKFDKYGTIDFLPAFKKELDLKTFYRKIIRKIWNFSLSDEFNDLSVHTVSEELNNIFEKYFYINNYALHVSDAVMKKTQILEIISFLKKGISLCAKLNNYSIDVNNNLKKITYLSKELEAIEQHTFKKGEGLGEFEVIISMFKFEIESLKGKNITELVDEIALIYTRLINRLNMTLTIINYFVELNTINYSNKRIT